MKNITNVLLAFALSACSDVTYLLSHLNHPQEYLEIPPYSISAANYEALKTIGVGNVDVSSFTRTADFDDRCRHGNVTIVAPYNMSFESYIQRGLVRELKQAGMFNNKTPNVTLSGDVEQLSSSSTRFVVGGTWDIGLYVKSSNGKSIHVSEHYKFDAGFSADEACQKVADNYMQATRNVLGKLFTSPEFKALITPENPANQ